jgi:hypothetical protein
LDGRLEADFSPLLEQADCAPFLRRVIPHRKLGAAIAPELNAYLLGGDSVEAAGYSPSATTGLELSGRLRGNEVRGVWSMIDVCDIRGSFLMRRSGSPRALRSN